MTRMADPRWATLLLLAPVVFVGHVLEEGPGFVEWFNQHVDPDITPGSFWSVNLTALLITLAAAAAARLDRSAVSVTLTFAWLSLLMFANALLHIVATVRFRSYAPGVVTAVLLYLPYYALVVRAILRERALPVGALLVAGVAGAIPMAVHGYLIVFRGSRLF